MQTLRDFIEIISKHHINGDFVIAPPSSDMNIGDWSVGLTDARLSVHVRTHPLEGYNRDDYDEDIVLFNIVAPSPVAKIEGQKKIFMGCKISEPVDMKLVEFLKSTGEEE